MAAAGDAGSRQPARPLWCEEGILASRVHCPQQCPITLSGLNTDRSGAEAEEEHGEFHVCRS